MGMTITEKILSKASGKSIVKAGENIWIDVDILMTHDVCGPPVIEIWKKEFSNNLKIWDKRKVVVIPDHYIFTSNAEAKRNIDILRLFVKEYDINNFYDVGNEKYKGVCHIVLAEEGYDLPGRVLIGTDSHSCTAGAFGLFATGVGNTDAAFILGTGKIWEKVPASIKINLNGQLSNYLMAKDIILNILADIGVDGASYCAVEFCGEAIKYMNMDERMTLTNMVVEMGAMSGIIECDSVTEKYLQTRNYKDYEVFHSDVDANYYKEYYYNVNEIEPKVAEPHSPDKAISVKELRERKITKCYIGSCTGGKFTDIKAAAKLLAGHKVCVPTYVVPATYEVMKQLELEKYQGKSLKSVLEEAGCVVAQPSCAACLGGPKDTVGRAEDNDIVISSTNRNFPGRMGSKNAQIYLASPLTVAASAIEGKITDPREIL